MNIPRSPKAHIFVAAMLTACLPATWTTALDYPASLHPGTTEARQEDHTFLLRNQVIRAAFRYENGHLFLDHVEDALSGSQAKPTLGRLFSIALPENRTLSSEDLTCPPPSLLPLPTGGSPANAWKLEADFTCQDPPLNIHYAALLHNGSNYLTCTTTCSALDTPHPNTRNHPLGHPGQRPRNRRNHPRRPPPPPGPSSLPSNTPCLKAAWRTKLYAVPFADPAP